MLEFTWRNDVIDAFYGCRSLFTNSPIGGLSSENVVSNIVGEATTPFSSEGGCSMNVGISVTSQVRLLHLFFLPNHSSDVLECYFISPKKDCMRRCL